MRVDRMNATDSRIDATAGQQVSVADSRICFADATNAPNKGNTHAYSAGMVDLKRVRAALRQLRTDANLTPEELADEVGVDRSTVYRIENPNSRQSPRIDTVSAIVESRGLTLSDFFAQIEGLPPTRRHELHSPPLNPKTPEADHGRAVSIESSDVDRLYALGEALAESFSRAVDRLVDARTQNTKTRTRTAIHSARRRKVD
jgi:transcriptional regulator with XRE-family HTH domain